MKPDLPHLPAGQKSGENATIVAVFGSSLPKLDSKDYLLAYHLGQALARAGYTIVNGGYGGVMAATAQGAAEAGAKNTIGVTCAAFGRAGPNSWIHKEIKTKDLNERIHTLIHLAQAYIVLPGSTGTLLEIALVWELNNKRFLPDRPIICVTDFWKPVVDLLVDSQQARADCFHFTQNHLEVIQILHNDLKKDSPE